MAFAVLEVEETGSCKFPAAVAVGFQSLCSGVVGGLALSPKTLTESLSAHRLAFTSRLSDHLTGFCFLDRGATFAT